MNSDLKLLRDDWSYPTRIRFGVDRLEELPEICRELEISRPLFVSDAGLAKLPLAEKPVTALKAGGFHVKLFTDFYQILFFQIWQKVSRYTAGETITEL